MWKHVGFIQFCVIYIKILDFKCHVLYVAKNWKNKKKKGNPFLYDLALSWVIITAFASAECLIGGQKHIFPMQLYNWLHQQPYQTKICGSSAITNGPNDA